MYRMRPILTNVLRVAAEFQRVNVDAARKIKRWLVADLSGVTPIDRPRSHID
jgi:hypothetical protein